MPSTKAAVLAASFVVLLGAPVAAAEPLQPLDAPTVGLFASLGYLGSPWASGAVTDDGVRWGVIRHLALSFDFGYGVLGATGKVPDATHNVEDRWWLMPAAAWVISTGPVLLDLGAGVGLAASSGYRSWSYYGAQPFGPVWAFQLVPAVRIHGVASIGVSRSVELFAMLEIGSLLLGGNSIGKRAGVVETGLLDTTWLTLAVGVRFRLL